MQTLHRRQSIPWEWQEPEPPAVDPATLTGAVPTDIRVPYDPREIICRIVDGSRFHEFKAGYGTTLVTAASRTCTATRSGSSPTRA